MSSELAEQLLERIAEDETIARQAIAESALRWHYQETGDGWRVHHSNRAVISSVDDSTDQSVGRHVARHDPARVLAECAAWRFVIEFIDGWTEHTDSDPGVTVMELFAFLAETLGQDASRPDRWPPPIA
ncbi:MAG: hypothetical protein DLM67_13705 [Candidatus Nephthysia bennettiae]|nr:MAG: hypothetical protein DLM67_13705 [Candidatus Dormibacteraeota bacterium]